MKASGGALFILATAWLAGCDPVQAVKVNYCERTCECLFPLPVRQDACFTECTAALEENRVEAVSSECQECVVTASCAELPVCEDVCLEPVELDAEADDSDSVTGVPVEE